MNNPKSVLRISIILAIILVTALFHACESEESITTDMDFLREKVVFFEDYEDYDKTLNEILAMNEEELKNYEESKGYKSFGRASEEFYRSIKWNEFETKEDIISFVEQYSHYLKLIEDENGELELETKFYKRADRYFLNLDNIYQVGESVYKIFEDGMVVANSKDIFVLKDPNNNIDFFETDARFEVTMNSEPGLSNLKSTNGFCGTSNSWRSTDGKNRLKVEISTSQNYSGRCHYIQRPYKRTLGIWFWCSRTMKADIFLEYKCWIDLPDSPYVCLRIDELDYYRNWVNTTRFEWEEYMDLEPGESITSYTSFDSYDVWADTYDVAPIDPDVCN